MSDAMYMVRDPAGTEFGPANVATLRQWHGQGRIIAAMEISLVGSSVWQAIWNHPELADLFPMQLPASVPAARVSPPALTQVPVTTSAQAPATPPTDKQTLDYHREATVGYLRELHKVSRTAFWGVLLSGGGVIFCCGCGGLLGIGGVVLGILSLDRNNIKDGQTQLDSKVRNGAVAAIVLGIGAMLINGVGIGILTWGRAHGWFGMK